MAEFTTVIKPRTNTFFWGKEHFLSIWFVLDSKNEFVSLFLERKTKMLSYAVTPVVGPILHGEILSQNLTACFCKLSC